MPANAKGWSQWPTLDSLIKAYPDIKLHTLRVLLRRVPCYKADDNTVRYKPSDAEAALRVGDQDPEDVDGEDQDDAGDGDASAGAPRDRDAADRTFDETVSALPAPVLLVLIRDQRRSFEDAARASREALRCLGETIRLMADPLRMGIQLNKEAAERNAAELAKHQKTYDRMVTTTEDLLSERVDRELKAGREKQTQQFRSEAMDLAKTHGVEALRKWSLTMEGTAAVGFLRSLDPTVIMLARQQGFITDEQMDQIRKVRPDLSAEDPPAKAEPSEAQTTDTVQ